MFDNLTRRQIKDIEIAFYTSLRDHGTKWSEIAPEQYYRMNKLYQATGVYLRGERPCADSTYFGDRQLEWMT